MRIKSALELFLTYIFSLVLPVVTFMQSCGNVETRYILCIRWALFKVQVLGKVYLCNDARYITFPVYFFGVLSVDFILPPFPTVLEGVK